MDFILFLLLAIFAPPVHMTICDKCHSPVIEPSEVEQYCHKQNLTISQTHRCCLNSSADNFTDTDIVGIDLRNCSLHTLDGLFKNITSVVVISLEENSLNVTEEDFYNLTHLDYLYLPGKIKSCPGGDKSWKTVDHTPDKTTCKIQIDTCETEENNGTCPSPQSYCSPAGPGLVNCLCSPDYHGYKCLRKGTFPLVPFVSGICGSTFVMAAFLWITQRRHVKKHSS